MKPSPQERKRARQILSLLRKAFPEARCRLTYQGPLQLLVSVILSAQCTDEKVNEVTAALFAKYRTVEEFAAARQAALEKWIYSTGFFRNKAKNIIAAAKEILARFDGEVPDTMEQLLTLPGVARKTANVVLSAAFGKNEGVVVDTHMIRVSQRLGLTRQKDPVKIEKDLMALVPRTRWGDLGFQVQAHGRRFCIARKPRCPECPLEALCPWPEKTPAS